MNIRIKLGLLAASICFCGVANAGIYVSGPIYGGNVTGNNVTCRIFNSSVFAVNVTSRQIFSNANSAVTVAVDGCNVSLAPQKSCAYSAPSPGNLSFVCRALTSGTDGNITGTAEIQTGTYNFITSPFVKQ